MSRLSATLLLVCSAVCVGQTPQIRSGATIYIEIEPMDGYETYLAAAIAKKHLPLIVVADKDQADYVIRSTVSQPVPKAPAVVLDYTTNVNSSGYPGSGFPRASAGQGRTAASISVVDTHSSQIVFAYAVGKAGNTNQIQSAAEACAKHLKEFIDKSAKQKK